LVTYNDSLWIVFFVTGVKAKRGLAGVTPPIPSSN